MFKRAYVEITNICNLRCAFCPGTKRPERFMPPEEFRILARRLRPHTGFLYLHVMGEPLLHPQLGELLEIGAAEGFRICLTTNGTLLEERGGLLLDSPAVERVSISLQSFEGSGGERPEAYAASCAAFAQAAASAGKRCALRLWNLDGADTRGANALNDAILAQLERTFPKPWWEGWQGTTLAPNVFLEWGERFDWPDLSASDGAPPSFCHGLRDQVGVLWGGTVVPCCLDHEGDVPLGNLYTQELDHILNSPRARAIYDGFSQGRAAEELCRRCGFARRFSR